MHELPDGADLLRTARELLFTSLLPALPADRHFAARMIANAMAIAARDLAAPAPALDEASLAALARDIRAGRYDPGAPGREEVAGALRRYVEERCAVSAPRALSRGGREAVLF